MTSYAKIFKYSHSAIECLGGIYTSNGIFFELGFLTSLSNIPYEIIMIPSSILNKLDFIIGKVYFLPNLNLDELMQTEFSHWIKHIRIIGCIYNKMFFSYATFCDVFVNNNSSYDFIFNFFLLNLAYTSTFKHTLVT